MENWFYAAGDKPQGPLELAGLQALVKAGQLAPTTLVWKEGTANWIPAASVPGLFPAAMPPLPGAPPLPPKDARGMLGGIGAKISEVSELPTISNIPVREILMGGLKASTRDEDIEDTFAVGTAATTPKLADVSTTWPVPRVFWRILGAAAATFVLLRLGVTMFQNPIFYPGMIVIGSFVVPIAVVILFFELNVPRNVSVYQVGKMLLLGGAVSLVVTMFLFEFIPGSGVGELIPALLTGVIEESGKALALLIVAMVARYRWQLNGLLFGAAVGAGFAGFESAGYAFNIGNQIGLAATFDNLMLRAVLAPGGHVIWTAMVGSAMWKVRGEKAFEMSMLTHPTVIRRWCIAVVLHGIWDADIGLDWRLKLAVLVVVGWYIVFAILKQAMDEVTVARSAPQPA